MESSERLASSSPSTSTEAVVVAVLGATGFLGRLLVREAARAGYSVRAVVRPSADPRAVAELLSKDSRNKVAVVRCETVASPSSPLSAALSGCSAVLCALAGRNNTGGLEGVSRMRSVEVDGIVSCFEAFLKSSPPPHPSGASFPRRRRFVAFAPPVRQLTRGGTRRPFSEYVVAKDEMERRLRLAAEAAFKVEREQQQEEKAGEASSSSEGGRGGAAADNASPPPAVAVTVFEVAAWGRDSEPIAAGLLRSKGISLVVAGGANKLQPLDEGDLAARVVRGLSLPRDVGLSSSSSSSSSNNNPSPFTVVPVGGPRVLTWSELVREAGRSVGVERPLLVSLPRWALEKGVLPAAELASRVFGSGSRSGLARAGYLARLAADVMATDLVAEEAVFKGGGGGGEARL